MADRFDLVIIGAGPGGYVAAIKGAKLGLTVAVVENREVGGTCLNRGCIPAKAMIHASQLYREMKEGGQFGIFAENVRYEYDKILEYKEGTSGSLRQGVEQLFKANGVTLVKGTGALQADKTVLVTGCEGEEESRVLKGKHVLLASGSKPMNLPIQGLDLPGVLTSDRLFELKRAPESLLIIGGGVIGAEFASVFSSLGIRVTIVEALPRLLANLDKDISQNLKMILKKRGIKIYTGATVKRIEETKHGLACVFEEKGEEKREEADYVLSAAGRVPETEKLLGPGTELAMEREIPAAGADHLHPRQIPDGQSCRDYLPYHGGHRCPHHAPAADEDEDGIQKDIHHRSGQRGYHGEAGPARMTGFMACPNI